MLSIPNVQARLAEVKEWRGRTHGFSFGRNYDDLNWAIGELEAALKALDLIKRDGHTNPEEGCLTCQAVAEFEQRGR